MHPFSFTITRNTKQNIVLSSICPSGKRYKDDIYMQPTRSGSEGTHFGITAKLNLCKGPSGGGDWRTVAPQPWQATCLLNNPVSGRRGCFRTPQRGHKILNISISHDRCKSTLFTLYLYKIKTKLV